MILTVSLTAGCFNPRLRAGGDPFQSSSTGSGSGFNPRLRAGGDAESLALRKAFPVSIHASAQEATRGVYLLQHARDVSIHASAQEATVPTCACRWVFLMFQSTPPRRRRPQDLGLSSSLALISCLQRKKCAVLSSLCVTLYPYFPANLPLSGLFTCGSHLTISRCLPCGPPFWHQHVAPCSPIDCQEHNSAGCPSPHQ